MSAIKGKHNRSTETRLRMALVRNGINGWKLHEKVLSGRPDFFFETEKIAVFVDGCFWHSCPKCGHIPKTRSKFWREKLKLTQRRDKRNNEELKENGIAIVRVWEHELKDKALLIGIISKIINIINEAKYERRYREGN